MLYGIKDSANFTLKEKKDGKIFLYSDYANTSTNEWSSDQVVANAKGVRAIIWNTNKQSTLSTEMEVFELKWLALLAGSDWVTGATDILRREVHTADETGKVTVKGTPVDDSVSVYELDTDNITQLSEVADVTVATKDVTSLAMASKTVAVYYIENVAEGKTLTFAFDKYPANFDVFTDVMITPKSGGVPEFVQMHFPNAKPQSNFTINLDANNPTNLSITFDLLPDAKGNMAYYKTI